jgi:VRR-NUC domain
VKEAEFKNYVWSLARTLGWECWHVPAPMRQTRSGEWVGAKEAAGLPDLIMMYADPPRLIFAELKGDGGKLSDEQQKFLRMAQFIDRIPFAERRRVNAYLWQPGDEQQIEDILKSRVLS